MIPMTLEGCVVRISDIIAYIGKDIEDAITLGNLSKDDLPKELTDILGSSNSEIMTSIVEDIIENSFGKPYISMSEKVFKALNAMKEFNYLNIYNKAYTEEEMQKYKEMFNYLFEVYLKALIKEDEENDIIKVFYNDMSDEYKKNTSKERVVIDYISGMTDRYMIAQYNKYYK